MQLGKAIKKYRKEARISQAELAYRAGLSEVYVGYLEQNRRLNPTTDTLVKVAGVFGVTVADIMREAEELS